MPQHSMSVFFFDCCDSFQRVWMSCGNLIAVWRLDLGGLEPVHGGSALLLQSIVYMKVHTSCSRLELINRPRLCPRDLWLYFVEPLPEGHVDGNGILEVHPMRSINRLRFHADSK